MLKIQHALERLWSKDSPPYEFQPRVKFMNRLMKQRKYIYIIFKATARSWRHSDVIILKGREQPELFSSNNHDSASIAHAHSQLVIKILDGLISGHGIWKAIVNFILGSLFASKANDHQ
jgi:hypothetical protein